MNLLVAENISKSFGTKTLFDKISFGINDGDKVGLIGINGTGKSTLLKIIAGLEETDEGTITTKRGLRISYLPQTPDFDDALSILDNVVRGKTAADDYRNIRGEATVMLADLGITDTSVSPRILSGGQRKRAALVRTLLTESDVLVLDEPTNHLDAEMTEWLEETLNNYKGAFICITHDRYFLDEVTNKIFELDKRKLYSYTANYSKFVELKAEREDMEQATERKNKTLFKQELAWMLRGARARSTKQKAHIQRFQALRDRKKIETDDNVELFSAYSRLGKKTLIADNLSKAYKQADGTEKTLFKGFSYTFLQNDRIGIIGPNGCGKSTLIKTLTGELQPDSGNVEYGITVNYGIFAQECEFMNPEQRVIDYIRDTAEVIHTKEGAVTASKMCERFLFNSDQQYSAIGKLSGGEKRRLYLLKVLMTAPNILILDEPTNDLDITTLTILEDYLNSFEGIIIAVSHDRYFLDKLCSRLFVFKGNGIIKQFEGNYTDYKESELSSEYENNNTAARTNSGNTSEPSGGNSSAKQNNSTTDKSSSKDWKANSVKKLKFTYNEQKEYETIDDDIASLEQKIAETDKQISESSSNYFELNKLMEEKEKLEAELEAKTERWIYLTELAEKIENQ